MADGRSLRMRRDGHRVSADHYARAALPLLLGARQLDAGLPRVSAMIGVAQFLTDGCDAALDVIATDPGGDRVRSVFVRLFLDEEKGKDRDSHDGDAHHELEEAETGRRPTDEPPVPPAEV